MGTPTFQQDDPSGPKKRTKLGVNSIFAVDLKTMALIVAGLVGAAWKLFDFTSVALGQIEKNSEATEKNQAALESRPTEDRIKTIVRDEVRTEVRRAWGVTRMKCRGGRNGSFNCKTELEE